MNSSLECRTLNGSFFRSFAFISSSLSVTHAITLQHSSPAYFRTGKKKRKEKKILENLKPSFTWILIFFHLSSPFLFPFKTWQIFFKSILSHLHLIFLSRISPLFTREKFKKLKCISWFFFSFNFPFLMVKVNKKKSVNNNNIFKVELEQLRSADKLLDNNLLTVSTCMCIEHVHTNRETLYEACFFYYFNRENERCSYICIYIYTIYIYIYWKQAKTT